MKCVHIEILGTIVYKLQNFHLQAIGYMGKCPLYLLLSLPLDLLNQSILFLFWERIEHENGFVTNVVLSDEEQNGTVMLSC
jgi:hypothetical protein